LERVARNGRLQIAVPGDGAAARLYEPIAEVESAAYSALTLPRGPTGALRFAKELHRQVVVFRVRIRACSPDLVVVATSTLPAALIAARLEGAPAIVYVGEVIPTKPGLARAVGGRALAAATRALAAAVVCCSDAAADAFGGSGPAVHVVRPGIDSTAPGDGAAFRRRHGLEDADPCVVAVGNISRRRGQDVLLHAVAQARAHLPQVGCAIVGAPHPRDEDLAFEQELHALAKRLGLEGSVSFAGFIEPIADAYAAADVVVNPIRTAEGLGRAGLEALAAGRPVIASRVAGVSEAMRDGRDALLVTPGAADELAEALARISGDDALATRLVASGREWVAATYSSEAGAERFAAIADGVMERSSAPAVAE